MRYLLMSAILFFCVRENFGQSKTATISLYYEINEIEPIDGFQRLDSLCSAGLAGTTIRVTGYADFLSDEDYNNRLSRRRAEEAKKRLMKQPCAVSISLTACSGAGEKGSADNGSTLGEPARRRVDVLVTFPARQILVSSNPQKTRQKTAKGISNSIKGLGKGQSLAIEGLSFIPGRHHVLPESEAVLKELLATMEENADLKIEIQGHICCLGVGDEDGFDYDSHDNQLSLNRAKAVRDYLLINGIDANRMNYKGYGHSRPKVTPEDSPEAEQANRRVEIKILE